MIDDIRIDMHLTQNMSSYKSSISNHDDDDFDASCVILWNDMLWTI